MLSEQLVIENSCVMIFLVKFYASSSFAWIRSIVKAFESILTSCICPWGNMCLCAFVSTYRLTLSSVGQSKLFQYCLMCHICVSSIYYSNRPADTICCWTIPNPLFIFWVALCFKHITYDAIITVIFLLQCEKV